MCFSATASFGAAAFLGVSGTIALFRTKNTSQLMFASIPFLFSIQQLTEGVLWTALMNDPDGYVQYFSTYIFLFFAQVLWTSWIPLSFFFMEQDRKRKWYLHILAVIGIITALLLGSRLIFLGATASIGEHHIFYDIYSPSVLTFTVSLLYGICTIGPCFISSRKHAKLLGVLLAGSLLITEFFYRVYLISAWCFFAAFISLLIVYMVISVNKAHAHHRLPSGKTL
jgi:hypothetical protein